MKVFFDPRQDPTEKEHSFHFSCSTGTEELLQMEAEDTGLSKIHRSLGGVEFSSSLESGLSFLVNTKIASRGYLNLFQFKLGRPDELYENIFSYPWTELFHLQSTFLIESIFSGKIFYKSSLYTSLVGKDAICDQFRKKYENQRPSIDRKKPDIKLRFYFAQDPKNVTYCSVSLDLTQNSLSSRGYRVSSTEAPLRENLAASCILFLSKNKLLPTTLKKIVDPFCGSGTFCFEWVLFLKKIPGQFLHLLETNFKKSKEQFLFLNLIPFEKESFLSFWEKFSSIHRESILEKINTKIDVKILGFDQSKKAVDSSKKNLHASKLSAFIEFSEQDAEVTKKNHAQSFFLFNPPYGIRLRGQKNSTDWKSLFQAENAFAICIGNAKKESKNKYLELRNGKIRTILHSVDKFL